jgi:hypothetical protein
MGKTQLTGNLTNAISQDASNNIGIGAAPSGSYKLEVTGTAKVSGIGTFGSSAGAGLRVYGSSGTNQWDIYLNSTNLRFSDNTGTGSIVFDRPLSGTSATFSALLTGQSGIYQTNASLSIASNKFETYNGGATDMNFSYPAAGSVTFTNGTPRLTITSAGNVGIGVTPSNGWVNGKALEVGFVGNAVWGRYSNEFHLTNNYYFSASSNSRLYASTAQASDYEQYAGGHTWYTAPSGTINTAVTFTPRMAITNGGNVLIGTTTDNGYKLQFVNDGNTASAAYVLYSQYYGGIMAVNTTSADYYAFKVRNGSNAATSTGTDIFILRGDGVMFSPPTWTNAYASTANVIVGSDGSFGRNTSSLKYKKNVESYTRGLFDVLKLRPVLYESKNPLEEGMSFTGFIAEEVEELGFTEFVEYAEDGTPDALRYPHFTALLVKAIQEQNQIITSLQEQINELKNK